MDQYGIWCGSIGLGPGHIVLYGDWGSSSFNPQKRKRTAHSYKKNGGNRTRVSAEGCQNVFFCFQFNATQPFGQLSCIDFDHFGATVCITVRPLSVCLSACLSVLSCPVLPACRSCQTVTLVYSGQTVGWPIKMKLGTQVGLGTGHVLGGDPRTPPQRGTAAQFSAHTCCGHMAGW